MFFGIFTLMLGVLAFVMFGQPVMWAYGEGSKITNALIKETAPSAYGFIDFSEGQNKMLMAGNILLIIAMVFCGIMMLMSFLNLIGRAAGSSRLVGAKIASLMFFLTMTAACVLYIFYFKDLFNAKTVTDMLSSGTIGYGLVTAFGASLLALFFSPRRKKNFAKKKKAE